MRIILNEKKEENICVEHGDLLIIRDCDSIEPHVVEIIRISNDRYCGISLLYGEIGFSYPNVKGLVQRYREVFDEVRIIKNKDVELIINEDE